MERLLQINIIGIHRRVLSPTKRPARRGFYIFSTLHLLLLLLPPLLTLLPIFFVSPPPPLPLAASHQRRTSIAPSPPPPPPPRRRCHHDRGTHTRGARELSFLLFAFFGIFPVAPSIVSRFVIVIRLHPAKRERGEGSLEPGSAEPYNAKPPSSSLILPHCLLLCLRLRHLLCNLRLSLTPIPILRLLLLCTLAPLPSSPPSSFPSRSSSLLSTLSVPSA